MGPSPPVVFGPEGLEALVQLLRHDGFRTLGPTIEDGAIVPRAIQGLEDLPAGWRDRQEPGRYRLEATGDTELFGWAVGPQSWKAQVFPARQVVWTTGADGTMDESRTAEPSREGAGPERTAFIGARPCEVAALGVLDSVFGPGRSTTPDPDYGGRRAGAVVVAVECARPAATCFCSSLGTGPGLDPDDASAVTADLVLTELVDPADPARHRFLARAGSDAGAALLARVDHRPATSSDLTDREQRLEAAGAAMIRGIDAAATPALLARNLDHPRWDQVAERCLACGNCTLVCPTCFCSTVEDTSDLTGTVERTRRWASCFELAHSRLSGGAVRATTRARYRQWLTHKLSTWVDQFGTSGCVGCGRCVTWCPVGIDLTEEVEAIRATDGARAP